MINRRSWVKLVIPLSTVDTLACYARVTHSRQWYNYNIFTAQRLWLSENNANKSGVRDA